MGLHHFRVLLFQRLRECHVLGDQRVGRLQVFLTQADQRRIIHPLRDNFDLALNFLKEQPHLRIGALH